jgi:hypothetical protein
MSIITNMLLVSMSTREDRAISRMHEWIGGQAQAEGQGFQLLSPHEAGGHKVMSLEIRACAGNHFPWRELVAALPSFGWRDPKGTILLIDHESEEQWIAVCADGTPVMAKSFEDRLAASLAVLR